MELFTQLFRRPACVRLPLLRPYCHLRLPSAACRGPSRWCTSSETWSALQRSARRFLSQRTADYQAWVEAFARNHQLPIEWAEKGRAQGRSCPALATPQGQGRRLRRLLHLQEHGAGAELSRQHPQIRHQGPKLPDPSPAKRSRFTHYYFYLRDETLGPMVMRVASFFPFQTTYYLNGHSFIEQS